MNFNCIIFSRLVLTESQKDFFKMLDEKVAQVSKRKHIIPVRVARS